MKQRIVRSRLRDSAAVTAVIAGASLAVGSVIGIPDALAQSSSAKSAQKQNKSAAKPLPTAAGYRADRFVASWPEKPQQVAMTVMKKYGPPTEATPSRLIWRNNGPWKQTIVYRDTVPHRFPMPHPDLLEQFIDYQVPPEKFDELAMFDGSVIAERTKGELSARCDKEEANLLALNLAHDIVTEKRTVDEAREFYARTIKELMAGQKPAYTQKLQFDLAKGNTMDPDHPAPIMASK